jgi:hypothetical protein
LYIPTPDASQIFEAYQTYYPPEYTHPDDYVDCENDINELPYYLDEVDMLWLSELNKKWTDDKSNACHQLAEDSLEEVMDCLEKLASLDRFLNVQIPLSCIFQWNLL